MSVKHEASSSSNISNKPETRREQALRLYTAVAKAASERSDHEEAQVQTYSLCWYHITCITGTQNLVRRQRVRKAITRKRRYEVYLLYWYKSTNTDAAGGAQLLLVYEA